jgi:hypothetical protein
MPAKITGKNLLEPRNLKSWAGRLKFEGGEQAETLSRGPSSSIHFD